MDLSSSNILIFKWKNILKFNFVKPVYLYGVSAGYGAK